MPLSKTPDVSLEHRQKVSDEQAFAPCSPDFFSLTRRRTTTDKNSNNMTTSPIQNLNSQSPSEKMTPVKKHHRHYHVNRPRSKSESEALHHRSTSIKKGNLNSPGGHYYHHVQSPMTVSPSSSKRSLGKMWIRPVSVKKNQWNQVIEQQHGTSSVSHPTTIPFLPDFANNSHEDDEDATFYTASNSSFHVYQRDASGLNEESSKKLAFTFGESGKPIKSSLAKRHSPTSVI